MKIPGPEIKCQHCHSLVMEPSESHLTSKSTASFLKCLPISQRVQEKQRHKGHIPYKIVRLPEFYYLRQSEDMCMARGDEDYDRSRKQIENRNSGFFTKCVKRKFLVYSGARDPLCPNGCNQRIQICTDSTETVVLGNQISAPNTIFNYLLEILFLPCKNSQFIWTYIG